MKVVVLRIWKEPAVFIGLLSTVALAILAWLSGADWDADQVIGVIAPFLSSLGIRQLVTPAAGKLETQSMTPSAVVVGTTYHPSDAEIDDPPMP